MARKSVLNKEQIIKAAFDLCMTGGISNITIRNIATKLKTSTAPIYTQYKNRDAILKGLDVYISSQLEDSMKEARTVNGFLNIGVGIIAFTLNYKKIVSEFYFTSNRLNFDITYLMDGFVKEMQKDIFLKLLSYETLYSLLDDMKVYTFGLLALICTNTEPMNNLLHYQNLLEEHGEKLINYHVSVAGKTLECEALMVTHKLNTCTKEKP